MSDPAAAPAPAPQDDEVTKPAESNVNPFDVEGDVDYDKLIKTFGSQRIDAALLARFEKVTGVRPHRFLRRGIFFSHRDLNMILDLHEKGEKFYLYTGRGPSTGSMHTGHLVPFMFTKWLQDTFKCPLVIQITDDEKFLFKDVTQEEIAVCARENIKDIIALGFDVERTFIFQDYDYIGHMYRVVTRIQKATTASQVRGIFGFKGEDNVGKYAYPAIQAAPSFSVTFPHLFPDPKKNVPCLIPCAIDQDAFFRMTRDIAPRLGFMKPALIHAKFFPALQGSKTKMGSSHPTSAVFLTDTDKEVKDKINKHAFSGGGATKEEHLLLGGHQDADVPLQWLSFFCDDDTEMERLRTEYASGRILSGEIKKLLVKELTALINDFKTRRKAVTEAIVDEFLKVRPLA